MSDLQLLDLISYDFHSTSKREAICSWVVDHLDDIYQFVPPTYPRSLELQHEYNGLSVASLVLGAIAVLLVFGMAVVVACLRDKTAIRVAQIEFLALMLIGSLLISVAAVITANERTTQTCVATLWLVTLGNSLIFVPLILKIQAINKLTQRAREFQRVQITKLSLFQGVVAICSLVMLYLTIWTILDAPTAAAEYERTDAITPDGETVYVGRNFCATDSDIWYFVNFGWQMLLLLWAAFLALQSRRVAKRFNETVWVALLIYASFILMLGQLIVFILRGNVSISTLNGCESILYSLQAIATIAIYFVPRIFEAREDDRPVVTGIDLGLDSSEPTDRQRRSTIVVPGLRTPETSKEEHSQRRHTIVVSGQEKDHSSTHNSSCF